jgi:SnoaL-like protein
VERPAVEDQLRIHDLYARYSWALDCGDTSAYVRLFATDAVVYEDAPEGTRRIEGHDQIREFVLRFHCDPEFPGRQHRISQIVISPDPEGRPDHWHVRSYALSTATKDGYAPTVFWCGYGEDIVVKVDGEWLIRSRVIKPWGTDVFRASDPPPAP